MFVNKITPQLCYALTENIPWLRRGKPHMTNTQKVKNTLDFQKKIHWHVFLKKIKFWPFMYFRNNLKTVIQEKKYEDGTYLECDAVNLQFDYWSLMNMQYVSTRHIYILYYVSFLNIYNWHYIYVR